MPVKQTVKTPPTRAGRAVLSANAWRQNYNPLRFLDISRAVLLLERERRGDISEIQWTYEIIDQVDPDMVALISLRLAAIKRLRPDVIRADPARRGYDDALAKEQEAALRAALDPLDMMEAVEDLAMATFRGFTVKQILRGPDGMPAALSTLDRWLFARDGYRGHWWWNPRAASSSGRSLPERDRIGGPELPAADFIIREERLAVDRACLVLGVRTSTCEKDWDAWCEMYGLNQAIVTEPPNASPSDRPAYDAAARAFSDGQGGTIPNGAAATFPQASRTAAPFRDRADYLTRKKVLAGTSGRLTMLAESGTGNLAGGAHQDTFDALADAEAADICGVLDCSLVADILGRLYPGRPRLASFALLRDTADDRDQAADRIAKLATHFEVDPAWAQEATGIRISGRKPAAPVQVPGFMHAGTAASALQIARERCKNSGGIETTPPEDTPRKSHPDASGVAEALARDLAAWREKAAGLLKLPAAERPAAARALAGEAAADPAAAPELKRALAAWLATAYAEAAVKENPPQ